MRVPRKVTALDRLERASRPRVPVVATPLPGGSEGAPGEDGRTVLNGSGAPGGGVGTDGDFYIDTTAWEIHGPKVGGEWGAGTDLLGEDGADGADGAGLPEGVTDHGLVEAPPASPSKGDRCHFVTGKSVWHLIADGDPQATGYPWAVEGAAPLVNRVSGAGSRNSASYGDCTSGVMTVPKVKVPLKGIYLIDHGIGGAQLTGGASSNAVVSIEVGATAPVDADGVISVSIQQFEGAGGSVQAIEKTLAANEEVKQKYRGHANTLAWAYSNRWVRATPQRVG